MKIQVRSPWFDDMNFRLHNFAIEQEKRAEVMEMERTGYEIVAALTGQTPMSMQPNMMGMNAMPMNNGMQPGMSGMNEMQMNNGMNNGMQSNGTWRCKCGGENTGRFCEFCGEARPY